MATIDNRQRSVNPFGLAGNRFAPFIWAGAVTIVIVLPWLASGYLFGTDWPGRRFIHWPTQLSGSTPIEALLAALSAILSAEVAAKLLVVASLFVAALAAFASLPFGDFVPRASASLIYVLNPFVYGRLHYGQFYLVAAYAVLPWVALRIFRLLVAPNVANGVLVAIGLAVIGMLAVHLILAGILLLGVASLCATAYFRNLTYVARLGASLGIAAMATLVLSAYWLIPYAAGKSNESEVIARIGTGDLAAYSAVGDPSIGLAPNLLGLYGFWAEAVNRFPSLKLFAPGWDLVILAMLLLVAIGAVFVFVVRNDDLRNLRWWVIALLLTGLVGLILEAGVADSRVAPVIRWLDAVFPPYRGMRDSGKWASILALVYAQLIPLGLIAMRDGLKVRFNSRALKEVSTTAVATLALALPLYYGNGLLFGMHGEVRPSMYPAGWYTADRVMTADPKHERALFLPWHEYFRLSFVRNVNSVISNPAPTFFSVPMVVSADPEVAGVAPPSDPEQRILARLAATGASADWATALKARNIKYVVLAKEVDWSLFGFFDHQPGFVKVGDYGSIVLYRVSAIP